MNKNLLIGLVLIAVLGVGGYFLLGKSSMTPLQPVMEEDTTTEAAPQSTVILYEQNESGESGTATLVEENGKVIVTLQMTGAPQDIAQPAHIHVGTCPDVGAVKYPLTSPVNGMSETVLDVTLDQLLAEQPLGLNVHKSKDEASVYLSCGDLAL